MKSHDEMITRKELNQSRVDLLKVFEVLAALGENPTKKQRLLVQLIDAQLWWLRRSKFARTKTRQYNKKIKQLTKKLGKG